AAEDQPRVQVAAQEREEVDRRAGAVLDGELARGGAAREQRGEPVLQLARAGAPEVLGQGGVAARGRAHQAEAGNRLGRGHERQHRARDVLQARPHRARGVGREQGFRDLLAAVVLDRGDEQGVLVAEVAVDGELGDPGGGRDLVHADAVEAVLQEHALGGLEDRRALGGSLGPAGGGPRRRTVGGQGHGKYWTREFGNYSIRRFDGAGSPSRWTGDAGSARVPTDGGGRPRAGAGRLRRRRGRPAAAAAGHG